jgi:DNA-nicking Smr family endonuclease
MGSKRSSKIDPSHPFAKLADVKVQSTTTAAPRPGGAPAGTAPKTSATPAKKPAATRPAPPSTLYDEDDRAAFAMFIEGVQPLSERPMPVDALGGGSAKHRARLEEEAALVSAAEDAVRAQLRSLVDPGNRFEVREDGKRVEGRRIELPIAKLGELRRGTFGIASTIDLHGKAVEEARDDLVRFLARELSLGERAVLVVHGKGNHSPKGQSVLRLEVAAWLSQGAASEYVSAFCTALPDEGGDGALRVLLRQKR